MQEANNAGGGRAGEFPLARYSLTRRSLVTGVGTAGMGLAGLAMVGCGDDDDDNGEESTPSSGADATSDPGQGQDDEQEQPSTGGTVVIATPSEPSILDQTVSSDPRQYLNGNLFQPLVWVKHDLSTEPMLAESWEQIEPTVWRFKIRRDVTFHNGDTMTTDDVVASFEYQLDPERAADQVSLLGPIASVEAVDEDFVDVTTEGISPVQPARMSFGPIVPRSVIENSPESLESEPVGTGPYKFKEWTRGRELVLDRYQDYWGSQPFFDEAVFRFIPENNVQLQSIQAGESDVAELPLDLAQEAPQMITLDVPSMLAIRIDAVQPPGSDVRVRRALNLAVDRQQIVDALYGGYGEPYSQVVPPTSPGYLEDLEPYAYDPDRARELIEEAGATGATLSMLAWADTPDRDFVEAVVPMFEAIGLNIDLQFGDFDTWLNEGIFGNPARGTEDPIDLLAFDHGDTLGDPFRQWDTIVLCESHYGTMCESDVEALVEEARAEPDPEAALALHEEINRRLYEDIVPWIMVKTNVNFYGASEGLRYTGHPEGYWTVFDMTRA